MWWRKSGGREGRGEDGGRGEGVGRRRELRKGRGLGMGGCTGLHIQAKTYMSLLL